MTAETTIKPETNHYGGNMDGSARGAANRQAQAQNKLRLVLCLFSLFMISLACGTALGAQADQLAKNGDARAQNNGAPSGSIPSQDPKADWRAIDKAVADQLS